MNVSMLGGEPDATYPVAVQPDPMEQQLDDLQQASRERQAELREIAAQLPAEMSRRNLVKQMAVSLRAAPDRGTVIKRTASKIGRAPADFVRAVRKRS
ncbi:hypothetical protein [Ilumatobacter sp.]|uniref:hypothetical protein n=1 Tax=Ilumatobacter sp. TaxID=1967498 RepID=UPI0037507F44